MKLLITTITLLACTACSDSDWNYKTEDEVIITGNLINNEHESRSTISCLKNGAQISFFANKGIQANGQILTFNDGYWQSNNTLVWNGQQPYAEVCAYNPPLPETAAEFYFDSGQLTDYLIAQQSYPSGTPISLCFEHLFSQINFKLEPQLNKQLQHLTLIPQQIISEINPYTGTIHTIQNMNNLSVQYEQNSTGTYSILIPPQNGQQIQILIKTQNGRTLYKSLNRLDCKRNQLYTCNVKEKAAKVGIENAEDFIAFTNLINGRPYRNRRLTEFGRTIENITTYYLNNDIHFTDEQKKKIRQIGTKGFNDVFDGQGHTLSNVDMIEERYEKTGLFTEIKSNGTIKNLNIDGCTTQFVRDKGYTGILCGRNSGLIINCSIKNTEINTRKNKAGGLVGQNNGIIINCLVDKFTITANKQTKNNIICGGITATNGKNGKILNCLITQLDAEGAKKYLNFLSCVTHQNDNIVSNCLSNLCSKNFHPFCKDCLSPCDHCYYPSSLEQLANQTQGMNSTERKKHNITHFTDDYISYTKTVEKLNNWIDTEGKTHYSEYRFKRWKVYPNNLIGFEMQ